MIKMSRKENRDITKILQTLGETVSQFSSRLSDIEERLGRIENSQDSKLIENSRTVPEEQGELGGQSLSRSAGGGIERVARIPVCDVCGTRLDENFTICGCGKKVCEKHAIQSGPRSLCVECLIDAVPLTKRSYKVLVAIANGVQDKKTIAKLARISKEDVKVALTELAALGFIAKTGWFIFAKNEAADSGIHAIGMFRNVYGGDEDVVLFDLELRSCLTGG